MNDNFITNFLNSKNITVKDGELQQIRENGFSILKRSKSYWDSLNIDLDEVRNRVEDDINQYNKKNLNKDKVFRVEFKTNRLKNLLSYSPFYNSFIAIPDLLYASYKILGPDIQLSSLNMREPLKGHGHQGLHLDWKQRKHVNSKFYQLIAFILLDKVTRSNGPPRIIPKSHNELVNIKSTSRIKEKRTKKDHLILENADKKSKFLCGDIGDIIILNINAFHGGTKNISGARRRVIAVSYRIKSELPQTDFNYDMPNGFRKNLSDFEKRILNIHHYNIKNRLKKFLIENSNSRLLKLGVKIKKFL